MKRKSATNQTTIKYDIPPDAIYADPAPNNFTQIPNSVIEDPNLSWKSLGILVFLLRNKNKKGWHTYLSSVIQAKKDKKDSVSSGLTELEELGYVLRFRYYDEKKKVRGSFFAYTAHPFQFELKYITTWVRKKNWGFTPSTQISKEVFQQIYKKLNRPNLKMGKPILGKPILGKPILGNPPLIIKTFKKERPLKKKENNNRGAFDPIIQIKEKLKTAKLINMINEETIQAIQTWVDYRQEIKKPIKTDQAVALLLNKIKEFGPESIIEAINASIDHGWVGLFPSKDTMMLRDRIPSKNPRDFKEQRDEFEDALPKPGNKRDEFGNVIYWK